MATSATPADALIHARGLTKPFANLMAVNAIDFDVERGEAFGFLGPNGAGKTNGAIFETAFSFFCKLKYVKLYDAVLATPLGVADTCCGALRPAQSAPRSWSISPT